MIQRWLDEPNVNFRVLLHSLDYNQPDNYLSAQPKGIAIVFGKEEVPNLSI